MAKKTTKPTEAKKTTQRKPRAKKPQEVVFEGEGFELTSGQTSSEAIAINIPVGWSFIAPFDNEAPTKTIGSYSEFIDEYRAYMNSLPTLDDIEGVDRQDFGLPNGYFQNMRGFDFYQIMKHADFKKSDLVLDVGALHTFFCIYLGQFVDKVHAVDNMYWAGRSYAKNLMSPQKWINTVEGAGNVKAYQADIRKTLYPDNHFDKIVCISAIEHIPEHAAALSEMHRILKPGGKIFITTEYHPTDHKPYSESDHTYYAVFNEEELNKLFEGYNVTDKVVNEEDYGMPFKTIFVEITK